MSSVFVPIVVQLEMPVSIFDFLRGDADPDRFAQRVMTRLRQRGWVHDIQYDSSRFQITLGGPGGTFHLDNIFRDWLKFPKSQRAVQLDNAIAFIFELEEDESWEAACGCLLPVVRNRAHHENFELDRDRDWKSELPSKAIRPLAGPLSVLIAIDRDASIAMIGEERLRAWGRSFDEVLDVALENLRARSPCRFEKQASGFYASDFGDWYDASRLLIPTLFEQLALRGDPVAVVVSREGLVVAGSKDIGALNAMAVFVEDAVEDVTRPISCAPLIFANGRWSPFEPDDVELASMRALWTRQRYRDYSEQAHWLQEHFNNIDLDRFIAPLEFVVDGRNLWTWTSWTQGARAVLPRADAVVLTDAEGCVAARSWKDVEAICGPFPLEGATYPQRYCGDQWPDSETFDRLSTTKSAPTWLRP